MGGVVSRKVPAPPNLPIEFIVDQHEFVAKCYANYAELGLEPGNPDDGEWQNAHYPAPDPEGTVTIPLLFSDHQIQGLLQSEEYGRRCFWSGHTKKFLAYGPFISNWFELWDIYDKWIEEHNRRLHEEKDELGRSVHGVKSAERLNAAIHEEKDELGRSLHAVKFNKKLHEEKDEFGRSLHGLRFHEEKNGEGKSIRAVENAMKTNSQRWMNTHPDWPPFITNAGSLSRWQKARGIDPKCRVRLQ